MTVTKLHYVILHILKRRGYTFFFNNTPIYEDTISESNKENTARVSLSIYSSGAHCTRPARGHRRCPHRKRLTLLPAPSSLLL